MQTDIIVRILMNSCGKQPGAHCKGVSPISKVVLIGPGNLDVQSAELIGVVLPSCRVVPRQNTEVVPFKLLSFKWVVGVHPDPPALEARTQAELELKT